MKRVIDLSTYKDTQWLLNTVEEYMNKEGKYFFEIKQYRETRTQQQNRYYWGVVLNSISQETGYDQDELHEIFKAMFLMRETVLPNGSKIEYVDSSRIQDTYEFSMYIDKIIKFAATELGIEVPTVEDGWI